MKKTFLLFLSLLAFHTYCPAQSQPLRLADFSGKWHVHFTSFPMWLGTRRQHPTLNYTVAERRGKSGLHDVVSYRKNGKTKHITGFDTPLDSTLARFSWRGKGLLGLLSSRWEVAYVSPERDFMVLKFTKTFLTAGGYDLIGRDSTLTRVQAARRLDAFRRLFPDVPITQLQL